MAKLEGIHIQNYRCLKDIVLGRTFEKRQNTELPEFFCFIGPNGSGKSSIMDAFGFIGDCLLFGVEHACDKPHRGGFERLRTQGTSEPIKFELYYRESSKSRPISYSLHIDIDNKGMPYVTYERLRQRRKGQNTGWPFSFLELQNGKGIVWSGESTEKEEGNKKEQVELENIQKLGITTFGNLTEHPRVVAFREFLEGWYLSYFVPQLARGLPMSGAQKHLNSSGDNLANYLQYIERKEKERFKRILNKIAKKIPGIEDIKHKISDDGRLLIEFNDKGYSDPFYAQDMSDGTLKMFAYLLLLEDPEPAPLIGIEEPENGLHHQLLESLAREMKKYANYQRKGPQIIITTHSPYFIDAVKPEEVWILNKQDGYTSAFRVSEINSINELFAEGLPLGSLWYSNHFGIGNP